MLNYDSMNIRQIEKENYETQCFFPPNNAKNLRGKKIKFSEYYPQFNTLTATPEISKGLRVVINSHVS